MKEELTPKAVVNHHYTFLSRMTKLALWPVQMAPRRMVIKGTFGSGNIVHHIYAVGLRCSGCCIDCVFTFWFSVTYICFIFVLPFVLFLH